MVGLAALLSSLDLRSQEVLVGSQGGSDISREVGIVKEVNVHCTNRFSTGSQTKLFILYMSQFAQS